MKESRIANNRRGFELKKYILFCLLPFSFFLSFMFHSHFHTPCSRTRRTRRQSSYCARNFCSPPHKKHKLCSKLFSSSASLLLYTDSRHNFHSFSRDASANRTIKLLTRCSWNFFFCCFSLIRWQRRRFNVRGDCLTLNWQTAIFHEHEKTTQDSVRTAQKNWILREKSFRRRESWIEIIEKFSPLIQEIYSEGSRRTHFFLRCGWGEKLKFSTSKIHFCHFTRIFESTKELLFLSRQHSNGFSGLTE